MNTNFFLKNSASPGPVTCEAENSEGIITTTEHIPEPG